MDNIYIDHSGIAKILKNRQEIIGLCTVLFIMMDKIKLIDCRIAEIDRTRTYNNA